jgi:hypothetical protein
MTSSNIGDPSPTSRRPDLMGGAAVEVEDAEMLEGRDLDQRGEEIGMTRT